MKRYLLPVSAAVAAAGCCALAAGDGLKRPPEPQPIELSGRLHRPVKWSPQLELIPAGQIQRFDLNGDLLRDLKAGTFLRVRGVVRSRLHRGGTEENPSPFPAQWTVWLEVTDVQLLEHPLDVLKEKEVPVQGRD